jgi:hypothetical protein
LGGCFVRLARAGVFMKIEEEEVISHVIHGLGNDIGSLKYLCKNLVGTQAACRLLIERLGERIKELEELKNKF